MSPVLILMAILLHLQTVSGIENGNGIVPVRVNRGERVILKCVSSGVMRSWLGPDFRNLTNEQTLLYYSNHLRNPTLNMSKYYVQAINGNYDLTISNFQKADTGLYICRCFNDYDNGTFNETKYTVTLLDVGVKLSTTGYERRRKLGNAQDIQINVKETSSPLPANQRHSKPNSKLTTTLIVVFLLLISLAILGLIARRTWGTFGRRMKFFVVSFRGDTERTVLAENTREEPDLIDEPSGQNDGLNYTEVLTESPTSRHTRIRGIENRIMYSEIDHSLKA